MTSKICTTCKENKTLSEYYFRNKYKGIYLSYCKPCVAVRAKKDYQEHREERTAYSKKYKQEHKEETTSANKKRKAAGRIFIDKQKDFPCLDCGNKYPPICMDFDHVRGKKLRNVGNMTSCSRKEILAERAKCDLVCSNCHRIRTDSRRRGK